MPLPRRAQRVLRSIRQAIPSGVVLGRRSAGEGPCEFIPLDEAIQANLDAITTTRGAILIRGASTWQGLNPGSAGQVLTSNGAGADPSYAAAPGGSGGAWTFDTNVSTTGTSQVNIDVTGHTSAMLVFHEISQSSSGTPRINFSPDGGTTLRNVSDYTANFFDSANETTLLTANNLTIAAVASAGDHYGTFITHGLDVARRKPYFTFGATNGNNVNVRFGNSLDSEIIDTIALVSSAGTFDAMDVDVWVQ